LIHLKVCLDRKHLERLLEEEGINAESLEFHMAPVSERF